MKCLVKELKSVTGIRLNHLVPSDILDSPINRFQVAFVKSIKLTGENSKQKFRIQSGTLLDRNQWLKAVVG